VKRLAAAAGPKASLPVLDAIPSRDDTLEEYLRYVGLLFGKDPDHWEQVGVPTVEVTEANGKRTITKTGIYSGTELHLWQLSPYFDERLDPRPECPELDFSVAKREISSNEEWRQVRRQGRLGQDSSCATGSSVARWSQAHPDAAQHPKAPICCPYDMKKYSSSWLAQNSRQAGHTTSCQSGAGTRSCWGANSFGAYSAL
jgi:hypothetical protein